MSTATARPLSVEPSSPQAPGTRGEVLFERVHKRYGKVTAVRDVSFRIEAGTLVTLLGPSGCGKTTTLRMIAGLELPSEGRIFIGGKEVTNLPASERDVGMVFQSYALFPHMTVLDNVRYGLLAAGKSKVEATDRARPMLELMGLVGFEQRLPSELSGGQQQRVALARALVLEPEVILFDEPLSNLDAKLRRRMREEIRELQQRLRLTAVYVTHNQDEALSMSDKIVVMDKAVVVQEGTPEALYQRPQSLFVARFMGDANVVDGRLERQGTRATLRIGALEVPLEDVTLADGPVSVALRPHALTLRAPAGASPSLTGRLCKMAYLGDHFEYTVETEVGALFVTEDLALPVGELGGTVRLYLRDPRGVNVLPHEPAVTPTRA